MTEPKRNSALWLLFLAALMVAIFFVKAYGQDHTCQGGHNCNDGGEVIIDNVLTGGDVSTGGVSTRVFSVGSDNDIADCMAHWTAVIVTWPARNKFCELTEFSNWAEHPELHTEASIAIRCSSKAAKDVFGSASQCSDNFKPYEVKIVPQTPQDDARIEALYARISAVEAMRVQDKAEAEKAVETAQASAQRANAMARQVQSQHQAPDDAAERRAKARAALKGEQ